MFAKLPRSYDEVAAALSFFQDGRWRRAAVEAVGADPGDRVLDVACGTGLVTAALVERWGCTAVGLDQSGAMLDRARSKAAANPRLAARASFVEGEAERLPFADDEFDHLTFTYLLRYVDQPGETLRELARVVKPGGTVSSLEFCVPSGFWFWPWRLYTRLVLPGLGRLVSRGWYEAGRFLGPSIEGLYRAHPLRQQVALWEGAGIRDVMVRKMSLGGGVVIWGTVAA
jgi:demethylmenaquinone methyltransferase/2-methoxy-6-polyprenyl-1,4-benzoquinol methylase